MSLPRRHPLIAALLLVAVLAGAYLAFHAAKEAEEQRERNAACPPGSTNEAQRERQEQREQRMLRARGVKVSENEAEREGEEQEGGSCRLRKHPEPVTELAAINASRTVRQTAPAQRLKPGAYAAAAQTRTRRAQSSTRAFPGAAGAWQTAGQGPLVNDLPEYPEVNTLGLADINGRVANFAHDAANDRLYAAGGEGGVWRSDDMGAHWRGISDKLPTQAVGAVAVAPAKGGRPTTVLALTGDDIFGGGSSTPGIGVWRTSDDGQTWEHADGVPSGTLGFAITVDPANADIVYAATGVGLYRSTDAGRTFTNVNLPTGREGGLRSGAPLSPDCTGATFGGGCFLANVVTDVIVRPPGGSSNSPGGAVVAAVGWRAGNKEGPGGNVESPNNGIYTSPSGAPGSFDKVDPDASGFGSGPLAPDQSSFQDVLGRAELGVATGPQQDHDFLYAIVQDASAFKAGEVSGIDVPESSPASAPSNTYLRGIYVSSDLGQTWTLMTNATALQVPTTGSALTPTYCGTLYCPGIQAWYNAWIKPDPTQADANGVPTRLTFGLEEVWQNDDQPAGRQPQDGPSSFKVIGRYYGGETCQGRHNPVSSCPSNRFDPNSTTTHPDQHGGLYVPRPGGGVTLVVGNDGGAYTQTAAAGDEFSNTKWGRGANQGFYTLLPYDAQVAKDGIIYAGLQDNGELKITPDGKQAGIFGGDGGFSAVDPDNSQVAYEEYTNAAIAVTSDGGKTWTDMPPPDDTYMFINPFTMDPANAGHLLTGGTKVYETTAGPATADSGWTQVFDLGAESSGAPRQTSATDVRSVPVGGGSGLPTGPKTADVTAKGQGGDTNPGPTTDAGNSTDPALTFFAPGTYEDTPFTIKPGDGDASAAITISATTADDDWDLYVYRKEGDNLVEAGRSVNGGTPPEKVTLPNPKAGDYIVRAHNYTASGTYDLSVAFTQRTPDTPASVSAAYVGFCGYCEPLIHRPFANGLATNVGGDKPGKPLTGDGWHIAKAAGLPRRYITSVQIDPADARTVYVTLGGYSRRWLPVGALGEETRDVGSGHVFKSTDAGETFTDISGDLPDAPANFSTVRRGQLVVSTDVGVYVSRGAGGGHYDILGTGLPTVPAYSAEIKPKANETENDTLIVGTFGRGVWRYEFRDSATVEPVSSINLAKGGPVACAASSGFRSVKATPARRGGRVRVSFSRRVNRPVNVDVFQTSRGRTVITERLVARFANRSRSFTWTGKANRRGRKVTDGYYFVRYRIAQPGKKPDIRRLVLRRVRGHFSPRRTHYRRASCGTLSSYKLERPVFGGPRDRALGIAFRLSRAARGRVTVLRGARVVRRFSTASYRAGRTYRLRMSAKGRARGDYRVRIDLTQGTEKITATLTSRRV